MRNGITPVSALRWVGWENYAQLLQHDASFRKALQNTAFYALFAVSAMVSIWQFAEQTTTLLH